MASIERIREQEGRVYGNVFPNQPALYFFHQDPYGFYFLFRDAEGLERSPFDPSKREEADFPRWIGGEKVMFPPSACTPYGVAEEIALEFLYTQRRSEATQWVIRPLRGDASDDKRGN